MITVITYGTFDLLHFGHIKLLSRAAKLGDRLVVGCSTDGFNKIKNKVSVQSYDERVEMLLSLRFVDKVIPESCWEQKRSDIFREEASIFVMGSDWSDKFDDLKDICTVIYLPRTDGVSTTLIKRVMSEGS
ncbi:adenylyltransferase/cytidyltransferase family protein [Dechloromonas sp. TW-R-39-2]|uniref:adenylyltransferase/cytidyltransferase family protein n=1 Tax=Dechloromonas sp. TW-R-39-2 TaxID=2654218 RepID=UPI00193CC7BA|nr:adenylyltransferase/cytidyltransferase family protein [Dechloromonas sp. TW-R-39-2]QRM19920.1 adenylyltransferase/cytidyltransferase family protein [Dechloromonas sp. TW-R-39-2]